MNERVERIIQFLKKEGLFLFIKKRFKRHILGFFLFPLYLYKISKNRLLDIPQAIDFVYNNSQSYFLSLQVKSEISNLLQLVKKTDAKIIMEIGTAFGGTLFLLTKAASSNCIFISLDLPGGKFGGGYPWWKIPLYKAFGKGDQKIHLIRKDSHQLETVKEIEKILNGKKIDFLFIDGDHTYEGVKRDFELYFGLVKTGGFIGLHDIVRVDTNLHPGCNVDRFWNELKNKYNHQEFVENYEQGWAGIGVITHD